ncbi:MAG: hypothetical protein OIF50_05360 [Flavobacteriaceae bacterium]|nr:hypothetical protein [Flavobacteriaceae bacterium]
MFVFVFGITSCENNSTSEDEKLYEINATGDDDGDVDTGPREDEDDEDDDGSN